MPEVSHSPSPGQASAPAPSTSRSSLRVLVAASVRLYREGLAESLRPHTEVVAVTGDSRATLEEARRVQPNVLLLDLSMDGALSLMGALSEQTPQTRVVVFAVDEAHEGEVLACAEAGAAGWVGRDGTAQEVVEAVLRAARGELLVSARTAALLTRRVATLARERRSPESGEGVVHLTPRESEIGALLSRGLSNKHIARTLGMRLPTVKNHVHSILEKLAVRSRGEAAARLRDTAPPAP